MLLCSVFGFDNAAIYNGGGAAAYIPAMLFASLLLYYFLQKHKALFLSVIGPLLIVCGFSRIINVFENLSVWTFYDELITLGVVRALADMSVGVLFAELLLPALETKTVRTKLFAILGLLFSSLGILLLVFARDYISPTDLLFYVFLFGVLITCAKTITHLHGLIASVAY